ncbi:MAG: hybrid sensor histidine kinase/response regulator [Gammaproteobacteria bacterium]|nr:hybrid sensor histidine kinase/response regulator [Gammaproteobacteria bacterium]
MKQSGEENHHDNVLVIEKRDRPRILVIDDVRANLIAIAHVLSDVDVELIMTTDPYEALTYTFKYDFALALVDVQMPKLDGYQAAEMMQSAEHSRQIPIVFVTANSLDESNVIRGYDVGAVDYITKPLNPFILRSKVNVFIDLYNNRLALAELNNQLNTARHTAEDASNLKSELLASLSSALKTPMHSIIGITDMGIINIDKWDKSRQVDNLREINNTSRSLLLLLNDIVDLSKLEAGLMAFDLSSNEMVSVVSDVVKSLKPLMYEKSIDVEINSTQEKIVVDFDVARIGQVVLNFLSNAIKKSPVNGQIQVSISDCSGGDEAPKVVRVSILDSGDGIPDLLMASVFDKFTNDKSIDSPGGAGLGLAICKEIIARHNGKIWAENIPDSGAIFSFEIPISHIQ